MIFILKYLDLICFLLYIEVRRKYDLSNIK